MVRITPWAYWFWRPSNFFEVRMGWERVVPFRGLLMEARLMHYALCRALWSPQDAPWTGDLGPAHPGGGMNPSRRVLIAAVTEGLQQLTHEERLQVLRQFCGGCGVRQQELACQCQNDE